MAGNKEGFLRELFIRRKGISLAILLVLRGIHLLLDVWGYPEPACWGVGRRESASEAR